MSKDFSPERDYSNALKLQELLNGPVKIIVAVKEPDVLVCSLSMAFPMNVLNRVAEIFIDPNQLKKVITLAITKHSGRFSTFEIVQACLKIAQNNPSKYTKMLPGLLMYFLEHPKKVIEFPRPTQAGPYVVSEDLCSLTNDNTFVLNPQINPPTLAAIQEYNWCETLQTRSAARVPQQIG